MVLWFIRGVALVGCPVLVYTQVTPTARGVLIGLGIGLAIVALEYLLESVHLLTLISAVIGAVLGIIGAKLLDYTVFQIGNEDLSETWNNYNILVRFTMAWLGMILSVQKLGEVEELDKDLLAMGRRRGRMMKVLDTSAIIDGRIVDILDTKFLQGTLVVPRFVLRELHQLSDSEDNLKRARGRRGLDILARLQESPDIDVKVMDREIPGQDVDMKVVRLAKELGAFVVTTDFNLNKIAVFEETPVLNVNDLAQALKPVVLPGEKMQVFIMKEGKEKEQGVGYLDDGTMVVIDGGKKHLQKRVEAAVTSILQTSAGRMVFAKFRGEVESS